MFLARDQSMTQKVIQEYLAGLVCAAGCARRLMCCILGVMVYSRHARITCVVAATAAEGEQPRLSQIPHCLECPTHYALRVVCVPPRDELLKFNVRIMCRTCMLLPSCCDTDQLYPALVGDPSDCWQVRHVWASRCPLQHRMTMSTRQGEAQWQWNLAPHCAAHSMTSCLTCAATGVQSADHGCGRHVLVCNAWLPDVRTVRSVTVSSGFQ